MMIRRRSGRHFATPFKRLVSISVADVRSWLHEVTSYRLRIWGTLFEAQSCLTGLLAQSHWHVQDSTISSPRKVNGPTIHSTSGTLSHGRRRDSPRLSASDDRPLLVR